MSKQTRRDFFKKTGGAVLGGVVVTAAVPRLARAAEEGRTDWKKHWGMLVDLRRCIGCKGCTVACKAENGVPLGVFRRRVRSLMRGTFPDVKRHFLPISCFHCEDPKCLAGCAKHTCYEGQTETAIFQSEDGYVLIDKEKCGADKKPCMSGCPYHNIFYDPVEAKADKCTFCEHRVKHGLVPACVQTCQGGALMFGDLKDPNSEIAKTIAANETRVLKPKKKTRPSLHYIGLDDDLQKSFESKLKGKRLKPEDLENDR
jgi:tetrathionate reductase subunit B